MVSSEKYALFSRNYKNGGAIGNAKRWTSPISKATATKLATKYSKVWNKRIGKEYKVKVFIKKVR